MIKFFKFLTLLIIISGCSYIPLHSNKNFDFEIIDINFEGDKTINEIVMNNLKKKTTGDNKYSIYYKTSKIKETVSSDLKGDPKIFKLKINLYFKLYQDGKNIFENTLIKQTSYNSINDKYELSQYESNILKNLSNNISDEILFSIKLLNR